MGPISLIDKSSFQSFSTDEAYGYDRYFYPALCPILLFEIIADLFKETDSDEDNRNMVKSIARKFIGSGPVVNEDFRFLVTNELLGSRVPMTGQIIPQGARSIPGPNGGGLFVDITPLNKAIMRWSDGKFSAEDEGFAAEWRRMLTRLDTTILDEVISKHYVIIPRCSDLTQISEQAKKMVFEPGLQRPLFDWFISSLGVDKNLHSRIRRRWRIARTILPRYAPYTAFCTKALLMLLMAERSTLVRKRSTNIIDVQYLFYIPFCMVFISDDTVHSRLAPLLLRKDQSFAKGSEIRASLKEQMERWKGLNESEKKRLGYALGGYPIPSSTCKIFELWKKHMRPWSPNSHHMVNDLSEEEQIRAIREATELFRAIGD